MTLELAFSILLSIASAALGLLLRRVLAQLDKMQDVMTEIRVSYQSRDDARHDMTEIRDALKGIKARMINLEEKKADK